MIDNASPGNPDLQKILSTMATKAALPEQTEPGPGDVAPTTDTKPDNPLVTMEMTEEDVQKWWTRVGASDDRISTRSTEWDILLKEYLPKVVQSGEAEDIKVPKHFRNVHSKIGQLFYKTPEPILLPKDPSPSQNEQPNPMDPTGVMLPPIKMEDTVAVKQAVLEYKMGRECINYGRLMDELLFDVLAWSGIGCSKLGYLCVMKPYEKPLMQPDPTFVAPPSAGILGLGPTPQAPMVPVMKPDGTPATETIQVPVFEEFYERRFSPKKLIINADLRSTRFDQDATMMGMHFYLSKNRAMRMFKLTEDKLGGKATSDEKIFKHEADSAVTAQNDLIHGVELFIKASYYSEEVHPQVMYQLTLLEGMTKPVVYRLSPDQTIDEMGKLSEDSLIGFPIKVLTIRDLADSPFPPADSAFTNGEIKQVNTYRRQSVLIRDAAIGHYLYDSGAFDEDQLKLFKSGTPGRFIPIESGAMKDGARSIFDITAQLHQGVDDARNQQIFSKDIDETLGIGSVQAGTTEDTVRTATEIANVQAAVSGRNGKELGRTVDFYLDSCRKLDQLLMRYATEEDYVYITGEDGARRMAVWSSKTISGRYLYDIAPDSQLQVDTKTERTSLLNFYNLAGNDPLVNRAYLLRRLARMFGLDPMKVVIPPPLLGAGVGAPGMPPQLPPPPGGAGAVASPVAQPPHGGAMVPMSAISKHVASTSGNRPNQPGVGNHRDGTVG